jgi:hypothetical protein
MSISEWPNLSRLHRRAYGGEDVAVRPDANEEAWWPQGPLLPGVEQMVADAAAKAKSGSGLNVYFLLGGAGNGKSFAARELARRAGIDLGEAEATLARRIYRNDAGSVDVVLLNDATIAPHEEYGAAQERALAVDLESWWQRSREKPIVVFCCVNRGIVVDEIQAISRSPDASLSALPVAVLSWLAGQDEAALLGLGEGQLSSEAEMAAHAIATVTLRIEQTDVRLRSLSVDSTSLVSSGKAELSPACSLLQQVLDKCAAEAQERDPLCPIRANVMQLTQSGAVARWGEALRAAELAGGRLLTYRDIWGLIALTVVGPRILGSDSPVLTVDEQLDRAKAATEKRERLNALVQLAQFRSCGSLFRAPVPGESDGNPSFPPSTPYQVGFAMIDPAPWGSEDARSVEDAMTGVALGEPPSKALTEILATVWSSFDNALEQAFLEYTQSDGCTDIVRRRLIAWYGAYLCRLVSQATGHLGNSEVIGTLYAARAASATGPSPLPMSLTMSLRGLLFPTPSDQPGHVLLVPAFAPRAEPIAESRNETPAILVEKIDHASVAMRLQQSRDRTVLECHLAGSDLPLGQLLVDFLLVREALAWSEGPGQTDATAYIEPRLERCRAATINGLPATQRSLFAFVDGRLREVLA